MLNQRSEMENESQSGKSETQWSLRGSGIVCATVRNDPKDAPY